MKNITMLGNEPGFTPGQAALSGQVRQQAWGAERVLTVDREAMSPEQIDLAYERVNRIEVALAEAENPPTDLDRFKVLFDNVGVEYFDWQAGLGAVFEYSTAMKIGCGPDGEPGAACLFWFDGSGKFVEHEIMR
jgi:hypothetical protein